MPSDLFELIILAVVAGFLIFRLYSTLGQRVGFEPSEETKSSENIFTPQVKEEEPEIVEELPASLSPSLKTLLEDLRERDPQFTLQKFLKGATQAFEMIVEAFAKGDLKTLSSLLGSEVYEEFKTNIDERQKNGEILDTTLVKIESVDLTEGEIQDQNVHLTVTFQTEQIHVTRDRKGEIIDGNPKQMEQLTDTWVFERSLESRNPNWTLIKTVV